MPLSLLYELSKRLTYLYRTMSDEKSKVHKMMANNDDTNKKKLQSNVITLITNNNSLTCNKNVPRKKEDEHITTAVMKVLEGYEWNLVASTVK